LILIDLENDDIRALLSLHSEQLTDDDLLHLIQQRAFEEAESNAEERDNMQVKEFTLTEFEDIFRAVEVVIKILWMLTLISIEA
jgi:hypothetical protein